MPPHVLPATPELIVPERLLPLARVCDLLGCHERTLRRWLAADDLRGYRLRGAWRITEADLAQFLEGRATRPREDS